MDKELQNLLDNYENVIYGKAFPTNPSIHQLHLLLDYIANLEQQCKKQKEVIDKAVKYIDDLRDESAERQGFYNCFPDDLFIPDINELLDILKEGKNE